jgi:hypothetical protein
MVHNNTASISNYSTTTNVPMQPGSDVEDESMVDADLDQGLDVSEAAPEQAAEDQVEEVVHQPNR